MKLGVRTFIKRTKWLEWWASQPTPSREGRIRNRFLPGQSWRNVLAEFSDNANEVTEVRSECNDLYESMCLPETGID